MTLHQEMINRLKDKDKIIFGPIIGSIELEVTVWAGFIRKYKLDNPKKKIIVLTRSERVDLYSKCINDIMTFDIPYEGTKFIASGNTLHLLNSDSLQRINTDEIEEYLLAPAIEAHPDAHVENISKITPNNAIFFAGAGQNNLFEPRSANFNAIQNELKRYVDKKWALIDPFNEVNNSFAQWSEMQWNMFFKHLSLTNIAIMIPDFESMIPYIPKDKNFIDLNKLTKQNRCTKLGVLIESIKVTDIVVGSGGITKELASFFKSNYNGIKYDSNPLNVAYQIDEILSNALSINVSYQKPKIIESNFSNSQGSAHLINSKTQILPRKRLLQVVRKLK